MNGVVLAAVLSIGFAAALAGWARLPFAPYLKITTLEVMAAALLFGIVGEVLERLKLAPKTKSQNFSGDEPEPPSPLPEPIPIVEAAPPGDRVENPDEPEGLEPLQTTPSTLEGGFIPPEFVRGGAKAVWTVERSPRDNPRERDGA